MLTLVQLAVTIYPAFFLASLPRAQPLPVLHLYRL